MSDRPINIKNSLDEAQAALPVVLPDTNAPLDMTIRMLALTIAQKHIGDTVIREGNMYQQLKMAGKDIRDVKVEDVVHCALVFERYIWGEWSKGIAENAMNATLSEAGDILEEEFRARRNHPVDDIIVDGVDCKITIASPFGTYDLSTVKGFKSQEASSSREDGSWVGEFQPDLDNVNVKEFLDKLGKASATSNPACVFYQYLTNKNGTINTYQYSTVLFTIEQANEIDETVILKFVSAAPPARVS
jgi:hypothetical protein